jgi:cytochrome c
MSIFLLKSLLALFFLLAAFAAVLTMLSLMGKTERKLSAHFLRRLHKGAGFVFALLLLIISYFCIKYWIMAGDQISTRAVFHSVLALGLLIAFLLKISIVQFFKQFLRIVPTLGMIVFCLAFVVFGTSAGYYLLRTLCTTPVQGEASAPALAALEGDAGKGASLFVSKCSSCHFPDSDERKLGPGLIGLFKKEILPHSQRPATEENIRQQLIRPFLAMPSFASLPEQDIADLMAYLQIL